MLKRLLGAVLTLALAVLVFMTFPTCAEAATVDVLTFELNADGKSYSVKDCKSSASGTLEIPATYNGMPVTIIGKDAFYYCDKLTSVSIPNSVTTIGTEAFYHCDSLTSIRIGDSVAFIANDAFDNCDSITEFLIDDKNPNYSYDERGVFYNKNRTILLFALDKVSGEYTIPDGVTSIGDEAFYGCDKLSSVSIPYSVNTIGYCAFVDCYNLTSLNIPDSVVTIGEGAFAWCESLPSVFIPDSVTDIGYNAFVGCLSLTEIIVDPDNAKYSSDISGALYNNDKSELFIVPGGRVGDFNVPASVVKISDSAFSSHTECIWVDENNKVYSSDEYGVLFNKSKTELLNTPRTLEGSYTVPNSVTTICEGAFEWCDNLSSVTIGNNVTIIEDDAFSFCTGRLQCIFIPESLTSIGDDAFDMSYRLRYVYYGGTEAQWKEIYNNESLGEPTFYNCDGLFDYYEYEVTDGSATITNYIGASCDLSIPSTIDGYPVNAIDEYAFSSCLGLKSVVLPESVVSVGENAFDSCLYLESVILRDGVKIIGSGAFGYCCGLSEIIIHNSVITIGESAFAECSELRDVYYIGTQLQWNAVDVGVGNEDLLNAIFHFHEHSYIAKITLPTCTEEGHTTYTCECGDTYKDNETKALGHNYSAATCTKAKTCTRCKATTGKAKGHTYSKGKCTVCSYKPAGAKITTQPVNVAVSSGKTAKVSIKATGTGLKYQWYYAKKGAKTYTKASTTNSFSVKMSTSYNGTKAYCVVTDQYGNSVKSSTVTLYKGTPAKITTQPKSITVANGKTGKLELKASGSSLKYQWYVKYKGASSFTKVGSSSKTYSFKVASKFSGAQAYCVVKDKYGTQVKSSVVTIKMPVQPKITTQPKSVTQVSGKTVKFTVKASGDGLKYQWYYAKKGSSSFKKLSGKTSATYSVKVSSSVNGRKYYCLVTDKYGQTVKSSAVTLTMKTVAKITTQPKNVSVKNGKTAKVTIKAVGDGLKYTWYYLQPGATKYVKATSTGASYSVKMAAAWKNAKVYCVIADKYGNTVKSNIVTLKMK